MSGVKTWRFRAVIVLLATVLLVTYFVERDATDEMSATRRDTQGVHVNGDLVTESQVGAVSKQAVAAKEVRKDDAEVGSKSLPPRDSALVAVMDELVDRSNRGDIAATCRLALDADLCRQHSQIGEAIPHIEHLAAAQDRVAEDDVNFIARLEVLSARATVVCADLQSTWAEENAWRYMLRAAQQGDTDFATRFAAEPPLDRGDVLGSQEAWRAYAEHAPRLLKEAASAGNPRALYFLQQAYAGRSVLVGLRDAIRPDPKASAMLALVLREFSDPATRRELDLQLNELRGKFEEHDWIEISSEAQSLRDKQFHEQPEIDFDRGVFAEQDSAICDPLVSGSSRRGG